MALLVLDVFGILFLFVCGREEKRKREREEKRVSESNEKIQMVKNYKKEFI